MDQRALIALSEVPLFKGVDILELDSFFRRHPLGGRTFSNNQIIAQQGDPYEELIVICSGKAAASMTAPNGKVVRLETLQGPCAAATAVLFSSQKVLPVSLLSLGSSMVIRIPEKTVVDMMQAFPAFLRAYLRENGDKLIFLSEKIRLFQFKSLRQKVVSHLLLLSDRQGSLQVDMVYSREELSQLMGVARPSLSREFSHLVNEGFIIAKGKKVILSGKPELLNLLKKEK